MKTTEYWVKFWNNYRVKKAESVNDLYFQVGKTVNKQPIESSAIELMVETIKRELLLRPNDRMIDLCSGNGLITYELAQYVSDVKAIDFAAHLIDTARELRPRPNVEYYQADVLSLLPELLQEARQDTFKVLMHDALAYFNPEDLEVILSCLANGSSVSKFFVTGVPDDDRKWSFYDTPARKEKYLSAADKISNDGMGRWWKKTEIKTICDKLGLTFEANNQPPQLSNYRFDVLVNF